MAAALMKMAKIFFVVGSLKLEVGEIPISNGEIINKNDAFAQIQAKITNTKGGDFDKCLDLDYISFEQDKYGHAIFTCNAITKNDWDGGNKRRKKSKKTKKKKQTKKRKTMKKK